MSKLDQIREKAYNDLYFFNKEVMGYSKMTVVPHRELCSHLTKPGKRKKLTLMPRGSFKSSVGNIGLTLWKLLKNPNERVLIASEIQKNSRKYIKEVKTHIESNAKFKALFGDWQKGSIMWRDDEFIINRRTEVYKEPSVMVSSLEKGTIVGLHFTTIILDDVVSRNNINTTEQINKTLDYYRLLLSILEPDGVLYINGTRWSALDLYGHLLDPTNEDHSQFDVLVKGCYQKDGSLLMPNVLTEEFLEEQRKTQGSYIFNCQYLNTPISPDTSVFKEEQIQYYDKPPKNIHYFMSLDPAISQGSKSDYSAIIINGVDYKNRWFIVEAIQCRKDPYELIEFIMELAKKYDPIMCCGMERFVLEKVLKVGLNARMEKDNFFFPVKDVETNTRISKIARIRGLQPKFEVKEIFIKKEHLALRHQIMYFPQVKNDDLLDALKTQLQIAFPCDQVFPDEDEKISKLTQNEQKIWKHMRKITRKKIKRKKWHRL